MSSFDVGVDSGAPQEEVVCVVLLFLMGAGTLQHVAWLCWSLLAGLILGVLLQAKGVAWKGAACNFLSDKHPISSTCTG